MARVGEVVKVRSVFGGVGDRKYLAALRANALTRVPRDTGLHRHRTSQEKGIYGLPPMRHVSHFCLFSKNIHDHPNLFFFPSFHFFCQCPCKILLWPLPFRLYSFLPFNPYLHLPSPTTQPIIYHYIIHPFHPHPHIVHTYFSLRALLLPIPFFPLRKSTVLSFCCITSTLFFLTPHLSFSFPLSYQIYASLFVEGSFF